MKPYMCMNELDSKKKFANEQAWKATLLSI